MKCCVSGCNNEATYVRIVQSRERVYKAHKDGYEQWCVEHVYSAQNRFITKTIITLDEYKLRKIKERL